MLWLCHFNVSLTLIFLTCQNKTPQFLDDIYKGKRSFSASITEDIFTNGQTTLSSQDATASEVTFVQPLRPQLLPPLRCITKGPRSKIECLKQSFWSIFHSRRGWEICDCSGPCPDPSFLFWFVSLTSNCLSMFPSSTFRYKHRYRLPHLFQSSLRSRASSAKFGVVTESVVPILLRYRTNTKLFNFFSK